MKGADVLTQGLSRLESLRRERRLDAEREARLHRLTEWQGRRLARTHADLLESPRYRPAVCFFLEELYAPRDFSHRDRELMTIAPVLARVMSEAALHTLGLAIEMNVVTEEVDAATDQALLELGMTGDLSEGDYAEAYRRCDDADKRRRQVELLRAVGEDLDAVVRRPFVRQALAMARGPARMAGLGGLHDLLARGHEAFSQMRGAGEFLDAICGRELEIMARIYDRHPEPFVLDG